MYITSVYIKPNSTVLGLLVCTVIYLLKNFKDSRGNVFLESSLLTQHTCRRQWLSFSFLNLRCHLVAFPYSNVVLLPYTFCAIIVIFAIPLYVVRPTILFYNYFMWLSFKSDKGRKEKIYLSFLGGLFISFFFFFAEVGKILFLENLVGEKRLFISLSGFKFLSSVFSLSLKHFLLHFWWGRSA
jgi:hypothetical protein